MSRRKKPYLLHNHNGCQETLRSLELYTSTNLDALRGSKQLDYIGGSCRVNLAYGTRPACTIGIDSPPDSPLENEARSMAWTCDHVLTD